METTHTTLLHLSLCEHVGPVFIERLCAACPNVPTVYEWSPSDWIERMRVTPERASALVTHLQSQQLLDTELTRIEQGAAQWITIADPLYPPMLRAIHAPPPILYWRGSLDALRNPQSLAIIGSRHANSYGARIMKQFVPQLVEDGFTIVSGGAIGADTMTHRETLDADGITVAVLGSGLARLYPHSNKRLFEEIVATNGALVSPFPMHFEPIAQNFPARNRIIAGLSRGCLVVQAAAKSGTRITADYALQQGREVFVVPGAFDDILSAGCHALARDGAQIVSSAQEICAELGIPTTQKADTVQQTVIETTVEQPVITAPEPPSLRTQIKGAARSPVTVDELVTHLRLEYDIIQRELWDMQWHGIAQQDFTGRWQSF